MKYLTPIALCFLVGCGGGGGGSNDTSDSSKVYEFAGNWSGFLEQIYPECAQAGLGDISLGVTVNQDSTRIVVDTTTGNTLEGSANSDTMTVNKTSPSDCSGSPGAVSTELNFLAGGDDENSVAAVLDLTSTCGDTTVTCSWVGVMDRAQ